MPDEDRERKLIQAQGSAAIRSLHLRGLSEAGSARVVALEEADRQLDRIARLLHDAVDGGVSMSEISRVTGVSRQTLYELRGRYGDTSDLRLAVLQGVLTRYPADTHSLVEHLKRPEAEIQALVDELMDKGYVQETDDDEMGLAYAMTTQGLRALQVWASSDDPTASELWESR